MKKIEIFLTKIDTSYVSSSLILYSRDLLFKFDVEQHKKLCFAHLLVIIRKNISYGAGTNFLKNIVLTNFHPNRDFKRLFFTFFILQRLIFQIWFFPSWIIFFSHLLVVSKEKIILCGASMYCLKKRVNNFFTHIDISKVCFSLFFTSNTYFSSLNLTNFNNFFWVSFGCN